MTNRERHDALQSRRVAHFPHHAPPHFEVDPGRYLVTAACFEHRPHIGFSESRMDAFENDLLKTLGELAGEVLAWVVLPNHYHVVIDTKQPARLRRVLGRLHGRSSRLWNLEENTIGRQVWRQSLERALRSDAHFFATMNYIHHNPVKHGYCSNWTKWKWSSAVGYLDSVGREEASRRWRAFPVGDYGKEWDP